MTMLFSLLESLDKYRDTRTIGFPFATLSFVQFSTLLLSFALTFNVIFRHLFKNTKTFDVTFLAFVHSAFQFGTHTFGVGAAFMLANFGREFTNCAPLYKHEDDLLPLSTLHTAYVFYLMQLFDYAFFSLLSLLDGTGGLPLMSVMQTLVRLFWNHMLFTSYPDGLGCLYVLTQLLVGSIEFGRRVLLIRNSNFHEKDKVQLLDIKRLIYVTSFVQNLLLFIQGLWVVRSPACKLCKPIFFGQSIYALFNILIACASLHGNSLSERNKKKF